MLKTGAVIGAAAVITTKKSTVFAQTTGIAPPQLCGTTRPVSPPTRPFIDNLPVPSPALPVLLNPLPTKSANIAAGEAARDDHQRWEEFPPLVQYRMLAAPSLHTHHSDLLPSYMWTFNGAYPAPTVLNFYGAASLVRFLMALSIRAATVFISASFIPKRVISCTHFLMPAGFSTASRGSLGSGVQARTHLEAMRGVLPLRRVRVWSRHEAHRPAFAEWAGQRHGIEVETPGTARETVAGADLICTLTASRTPVLMGEWMGPGTHVNAVGASLADTRELDTEAVVRARLFVDRRESALSEAGDFLIPRAEGAISNKHLRGELGDLLLGRLVGREDDTQVTLFKSLGLAVEDVASAHVVHREAERRNVGTMIELGGLREAVG